MKKNRSLKLTFNMIFVLFKLIKNLNNKFKLINILNNKFKFFWFTDKLLQVCYVINHYNRKTSATNKNNYFIF